LNCINHNYNSASNVSTDVDAVLAEFKITGLNCTPPDAITTLKLEESVLAQTLPSEVTATEKVDASPM